MREKYFLEKDYIVDLNSPGHIRDVPMLDRIARVTAKCVAQFADGYRVRHLIRPVLNREGLLPHDTTMREALIDEIFDSFEFFPDPQLQGMLYLCLDLSQADHLLLNQGDGIIEGILNLTHDQFRVLRACWERHGLPHDLYYPAEERRVTVEKVERRGQVLNFPRAYTPRQWARRSD